MHAVRRANARMLTQIGLILVLAAMLLGPAVPSADALGDAIAMYRGGKHPVTYNDSTDAWAVSSPLWNIYDPATMWLQNDAITSVALSGLAITAGCPDCSNFRGVGSGTVAPADGSPVYTVYNVALEASPGLPVLSGLWIDNLGHSGAFAAFGEMVRYDIGGTCLLFIHHWAFARGDITPEEILAYLEGQLPDNNAPGVPELVAPAEGHTFLPGQLQMFSIQATDPDDDDYVGRVEVKRPGSPGFDSEFDTILAASGERSDGVPPVPYGGGTGYQWRAWASDLFLAGPASGARSFNVAGPPVPGPESSASNNDPIPGSCA
jgi:hypothetical protein